MCGSTNAKSPYVCTQRDRWVFQIDLIGFIDSPSKISTGNRNGYSEIHGRVHRHPWLNKLRVHTLEREVQYTALRTKCKNYFVCPCNNVGYFVYSWVGTSMRRACTLSMIRLSISMIVKRQPSHSTWSASWGSRPVKNMNIPLSVW